MKSYRIESDNYGYRVKWNDGGQVPQELKTLFTSQRIAQTAVDLYEAKRPKAQPKRQVKSNGNKKNTG